MNYNLISFILIGLAIFLLLALLIIRKKRNGTQHDAYEYSALEESIMDSPQQSEEMVSAAIWSGTLIDSEVKDNSHLSNVFLRDVPGADEIQVKSGIGKFQFK